MKRILFCICFVFVSGIFADKSDMDSWRDLNQLHRTLKKLDLSNAQEEAIKNLFKQYHLHLKKFWEARGETDDFVMKLFSQKKLDIDRIEDKFKENYQKKSKIDLKFLESLHSILNNEQRIEVSKDFDGDD